MVKSLVSTALLLCAGTLPSAAESPAPSVEKTPPPVPQAPASTQKAASSTASPPATSAPAIKSLGGPRHELNGITFNEDTRAITLPALVNMTEGLLEYALVHEAGKAHESLLTTTISPYDLNVVLLLLNYQPAATFFDFSDKKAGAMLVKNPKIAPAAQLTVSLSWQDAAGKPQTADLPSLLLNADQKAPVTPGPFTYTGSFLTVDGIFMAKETGSILALYVDAAALINNPRPGSENDDIWLPDKSKIPPKGTPLTVTLTPAAK